MHQLPTIKIDDKTYYVDQRLNELRNVNDFNDRESMNGMSEMFWVNLYK